MKILALHQPVAVDLRFIVAAIKINNDLERIGDLINLLLISRHLERLADHATNIAEEVIYLIEGGIVRHGQYDHGRNHCTIPYSYYLMPS